MINVSDKVRELYKTDRIPIRKEPITKKLFIRILETGTVISDADMELENFTLEESICSAGEIVFGSCEASFVSFAVYQTVEDLSSKTVRIWQTINGNEVPFGTYKVATVTKRDGDPRWKDITAYDRMPELDRDATAWFTDFWNRNPVSTIKEFRTDFFRFMGFDIVDQELINDHMEIKKTIDPEFIKARYIAQKIGEINASFGHFTRENKFKYIDIGSLALYPAEDLYPSEDLFPSESTEILSGDSAMLYFADESHYEDYYVRAIDSVQIKASDGSAGVTVGEENKNPYIIHSNFFTFGKNEQEVREIAGRFLNIVKYKFYTPNTTSMIGLPYLEVGDTVAIYLEQDAIETFIFQRIITGIHALKDEITAKGNEYRKNDMDEGTELMQLKSKVENVVADTDQKLEDFSEDVGSRFDGVNEEIVDINSSIGGIRILVQQNSDGLSAEVSRAMGEEAKLSSQIVMTANEIRLAVSETYETKTDSSSKYANLSSEIKLTAQDITSTVSQTYETKTAASQSYSNLSSQIVQSANSITATVSATYETKNSANSNYTSLSSEIRQTATQISQKVSRGDVVSEINQSADTISLSAGRLLINTGNFTLDRYGNIGANGGTIGGFTITGSSLGGELVSNATTLGPAAITTIQANLMTIRGLSNHQLSGGGGGIWMGNDTPDINMTAPAYFHSSATFSDDIFCIGAYSNVASQEPNVYLGDSYRLRRTAGSLAKWKNSISEISDPSIDAHRLYNVRPRQFKYNDDYLSKEDCRYGKFIPGFIVDELKEDYPIAVEYGESGSPENWGARFFIAPMLQLIQEQHKQIEEMKDQLTKIIQKIGGNQSC